MRQLIDRSRRLNLSNAQIGTGALILTIAALTLVVASVRAGSILGNQDDSDDAAQILAHKKDVQELLSLSPDEHPDVVARVNGHEITGRALAQRIFFLSKNPPLSGMDGKSPEEIAVRQLIEEYILIDAAEDLGVRISEDEAQLQASEQEKILRDILGDQVDEMFEIYATQIDAPPDAFMSHPQTIEAYRISMTLAGVRAKLEESIPEDQRENPSEYALAYQAAVDEFVESRIESLEIFVE